MFEVVDCNSMTIVYTNVLFRRVTGAKVGDKISYPQKILETIKNCCTSKKDAHCVFQTLTRSTKELYTRQSRIFPLERQPYVLIESSVSTYVRRHRDSASSV